MAIYGDDKHNINMEYITPEITDNDLVEFGFAVDIPRVDNKGIPMEEWHCVEYFRSKEDAIKYAQENFGADENGMVCLISNF